MRYALLVLALVLGCGGDDGGTGPGSTNFSGTYQGQYYVIVTSTAPIQGRDSVNGGAVTLTLAQTRGEEYTVSISGTSIGGFAGDVTVNSAGIVDFPNYDEEEALDGLASGLLGICDTTNANLTPSGVVASSRLTIMFSVSGLVCDLSGNGTDLRVTRLDYTFTGTALAV